MVHVLAALLQMNVLHNIYLQTTLQSQACKATVCQVILCKLYGICNHMSMSPANALQQVKGRKGASGLA